MENNVTQWFIVTAIGGKEDSIADALKEKIHNFGYDSYVRTIRIFKDKLSKEDIFSKNDASLPKSLKNTKNTTWTTLSDGRYKKTYTRIVNKFPGYIFINMIMNPEVWYAVRNTPGILGFVGSSGKGAMPIPISLEEYNKIDNDVVAPSQETTSTGETTTNADESRKVFTTDIKVGNNVEIVGGSFAGMTGDVKALDSNKGVMTIEVEMFGRVTSIEVNYDDVKIA
ncbi:MAG: transcription termination/antitermination protein NusG [Mycoplasmataceae bacterium]|nr:transcription termination/antitermination protein NusG [Mycoplasmataceae bacterium]